MWSRVATSSAIRTGWPRSNTHTAVPTRSRVVLAAIAVAKIRGEATTEGMARPLPGGAKWRSANQIPSKPTRLGVCRGGKGIVERLFLGLTFPVVTFHHQSDV